MHTVRIGAGAADPTGQNDPLISADYRTVADFAIGWPLAIDRVAVLLVAPASFQCPVLFLTFRCPLPGVSSSPFHPLSPLDRTVRAAATLAEKDGNRIDVFRADRSDEFFESDLPVRSDELVPGG